MPETALHWLVLILLVSVGQFALKLFFAWLAGTNLPFAHKLGTSMQTIIP